MINKFTHFHQSAIVKNLTKFKINVLTKAPAILFVHIPKTAGTSFRFALEEKRDIEKDYGANSEETTPFVFQHAYKQLDGYKLKSLLIKNKKSLAGHVSINRYADFFDVRNIVSFIREPLAQTISHYNHLVTYGNLKQTFAEFYSCPAFVNFQSKQLQPLPISLIGFLGITECYSDSLAIINYGLQTNFKYSEKNKCIESHQEINTLKEEDKEKLTLLNANDIELYQQAVNLHQQRLAAMKANLPWVHLYAEIQPNDHIIGCAYYAENNEAVEIEILFNDIPVHKMKANQFTGLYPKFNFPRERYVGFHWLPNKKQLNNLKKIQIKVLSTKQIYDVKLPLRFSI